MGTLENVIQQLVEALTSGLTHILERYTNRILHRALRVLVLAGLGVAFLAVGSIFILISIVTYLSRFMFSGLAWGIVGLITALVGAVMLLLIRS